MVIHCYGWLYIVMGGYKWLYVVIPDYRWLYVIIPLPTIGNSLKKQKSLYKVLTPSIKPTI